MGRESLPSSISDQLKGDIAFTPENIKKNVQQRSARTLQNYGITYVRSGEAEQSKVEDKSEKSVT